MFTLVDFNADTVMCYDTMVLSWITHGFQSTLQVLHHFAICLIALFVL